MTEISQFMHERSLTLYENCIILGPMVRINSLPLRLMCLEYGVHTVFSEEIIDKRIVKCSRKENFALNTIDFVVDNTLLFRTHKDIEKGRCVLQLGTSNPLTALQAVKIVENDVAAIDINMGCPKKFSIQAGDCL